VPVNTDDLTTPITGQFEKPLKDIMAGDLFRDIRNAHYNINTGIEQRNMQRQKLAEKIREHALAAPKQSE
jgi:ribosome-binding protein aMBF1 (putative translation factor)